MARGCAGISHNSGTFLKISTLKILPCPPARFSNFQLKKYCHVPRHVSQISNFKNIAMSPGTFLKFSILKTFSYPPTISSLTLNFFCIGSVCGLLLGLGLGFVLGLGLGLGFVLGVGLGFVLGSELGLWLELCHCLRYFCEEVDTP